MRCKWATAQRPGYSWDQPPVPVPAAWPGRTSVQSSPIRVLLGWEIKFEKFRCEHRIPTSGIELRSIRRSLYRKPIPRDEDGRSGVALIRAGCQGQCLPEISFPNRVRPLPSAEAHRLKLQENLIVADLIELDRSGREQTAEKYK